MDGYLAVNCILTTNYKQIPTSALIDFCALSDGFIDHSFVDKHSIFLILLNSPQTLEVFDGTHSDYRQIIHISKTDYFALNHHEEQTVFLYVIYFSHYAIVFKNSWLQKYNPNISWKENKRTFKSLFCSIHYCTSDTEITFQGLKNNTSILSSPTNTSTTFSTWLFLNIT